MSEGEKLTSAIEIFIKKFQNVPLHYLFESDLKCGLYNEIKKLFSGNKQLNTTFELSKYYVEPVKIPEVTTEYKYFKHYKSKGFSIQVSHCRFDIAILGPEIEFNSIKTYSPDYDYTGDAMWLQPVRYGIELKLFYTPNHVNLITINNEIEKLDSYEYFEGFLFNGISLNFCYTDFDNNIMNKLQIGGFTQTQNVELFSKRIDCLVIFKNKIFIKNTK
ncbi:MAG TPA: hypothetical protein VHP32_04575 [Ignavibacteria bacterium]|nr:hypothetical protein [Ignavibacteria bacterium]